MIAALFVLHHIYCITDTMTDTSCSDSDVSQKGKDSLSAGSKAFLNNSPLEAVENFKSVLEKSSSKSNQKISMSQLVLRYALCVALIKCNDYKHIAEAATIILELLESGYGSKLPALYLALGNAYFALFRFKSALDTIEKGLKTIQTYSKIKQHMWPGLQQPIDDTIKENLHKELLNLQKDCKEAHSPDAVCRFDKCIEHSTHLIPTQDIYLTDPDFKPFLYIQCNSNCKYAYHYSCWEHLKGVHIKTDEPKDILGTTCSLCSSKINNDSVIVEVNIIGSEFGFDKPIYTWLLEEDKCSKITSRNQVQPNISSPLKNNVKPVSSNGSLKANPKLTPMEDDSYSEHSSLCSSQDDITSESLDSSKLTYLLDTLHQCRKMDFGYSPSEYMNPELQCFGHPYVSSSNFVEPNEIDESDRDQADFVFSYYYSVFERNGLHRLEDLQEMWKTTISDLELPESFTNKYSNVAEFLLKSEKFAAIDEFIGTSDLLPDMFSKAQVEIAESVSFLLFSQEQNTISKDEHLSADTFNNAWKIKMNNNNCDPHTHHIQSSDSSSDRSDEHVAVSKDNNDNPLLSTTPEVNGNSNSGCNASSMNDVYMSDEDEEIDTSLVLDGVENGKGRDMPFRWNESKTKPDVFSKHSQTDQILDAEKENLAKSKDSLLKEVSELRYEKGELHQRIETLQSQMENNRASMESIHKSTLKQTQEQHNKELLEKTKELKEIQDKHSALEQTIIQLKAKVDERESEVAKLTSSLQKIQRNHAKEMNNFEEGMKTKLADTINQSKYKDQRYIQLWKDFCEFKINKFNQSCNDRINVLSQLRDMVSESVHPTKSDIISIIEKYEDGMISVTQKNAEVNDVFNQQMEKMRSGLEVYLPAVVDVPDLNMPYPPEGVFDYLRSNMKPKQEDFAAPPVPQNHFLSGNSRFYPRPFNGLQSRENEGFAPAPTSSSIFGQGHNETSHLWNSMSPFPMSSDVSNTTTPQFQGFGSSNPLMQQSTLNLMPSLMSYPTSSSNSLLGQRASPSPLSNVNGSAFNPAHTSGLPNALGALAAPGSKLPSLNPKLPASSSTAAVNQVVKPMATPAPAPAPAPVPAPSTASSQGAIPKPKVPTATASMTPIVPSRPKPVSLKGGKSESNYEKLMRNLQKMFPTRNDMELTQALKMARERNNNTLSSLSHSEIVSKVEEILNSFRKQTSMSWEKFGQAAWGTAKTPVIEWEGQEQDECCICMNAMHAKEIYTLECKHAFHKDCIKKWLEQESVCPNCRTHSTMVDEFPPLA